jgi:hypothetical protein
VTSQPCNWFVVLASEIPDDAGMIGATSHHDPVIVLEAENGSFVVVGRDVINGVALWSAVHGGMRDNHFFVGIKKGRSVGRWSVVGAADYLLALIGLHVPDADCAVTRASNDFVSEEMLANVQVRKKGSSLQEDETTQPLHADTVGIIGCPITVF